MKKLSLLMAMLLALLASACSNTDEGVNPTGSKTITFHTVNFMQAAFPEEPVTRGTLPAEELAHVACVVYDKDQHLVGEPMVQSRGDEGYGTFQISLEYGTYTIVFIGYDQDAVLDATSFSAIGFADGKAPQTFLCTKEISVSSEVEGEQSVRLQRISTMLKLHLNDELPANLASMTLSIQGASTTFSGATGLASSPTHRTATINIPGSLAGQTDTELFMFAFLPQTESEVDITLTARNATGGIIQERRYSNVTMKVNQILQYTGDFFSRGFGVKVDINDAWDEDQMVSF